MALFKIFKGNNTAKITNSSATGYITPTDGYAYYDTSSKLFYIDAAYSGTTISRQSINADNATNGVFYGTCATGQGTKAKVATLTNGTGFSLKAGTIVAIKFTYASAASTMTLNVNSTGAKNLYQYGTTLMNSGTTTTGWPAGAIVPFVYDGTYWFRLYWTNTGTVTSITPGNGLLNGTGTSAITTTGTLNLNYGTSASAIGTTSAAGSANTVSRSDHVHSITLATGDNNGQVKIAGTNVSVKGLGSNAYTSTAYAPLASPALTGTPTAPTPAATSNDTTIATTAFVMNAFTANDAMVFKGVVNENGDLPATHKQGWTYRVATAGTYAGKVCEVGDMIVCVTDGTAATDAHWAVIQNNIDGAVYRGTNAFTDANVIVADSTNGKVKSSGKTITTTAPSSSAADTTIPTSKAVWSAISGASGYGKTGTVTSVRVQATAPIVSSSSAAATTSLNTTISLAATSANYIIAGPTSGTATAVPTYRKLVAADIPSLTKSKISDFPTSMPASDVSAWAKAASKPSYSITEISGAGNAKIFYGSCSTAAATTTKAVTCANFTSADLVKGAIIYVTFTTTNSGAIASLKLNVNSTGEKPIKYMYNNTVSDIPDKGYLLGNQTYIFHYDGTNWVIDNMHYNSNTNTLQRTYRSSTNVELPIAAISTTGSATAAYSAISSDSYKDVYAAIPNTDANRVMFNPSTGLITFGQNGLKTSKIQAPTAAGGSTYGAGSSGQALMSNGSTVYWGTPTSDINLDYGETLPSSASEGDIFFQLSNINANTSTITADKINTTAATSNTNYYLVGAVAAGEQSPYISTANSSGTSNTAGVYFNGATGVLSGAAWNDYAEFREKRNIDGIPYGFCVIENGDDTVSFSTQRLQPCGQIVSDTYGFTLGKEENNLPIAVCGRVLAYPYEDRKTFFVGDAVCTAPDGKVSKMTREEIKEYPDRIIGYVSSIPNYQVWGDQKIQVKGRIWIKVK